MKKNYLDSQIRKAIFYSNIICFVDVINQVCDELYDFLEDFDCFFGKK